MRSRATESHICIRVNWRHIWLYLRAHLSDNEHVLCLNSVAENKQTLWSFIFFHDDKSLFIICLLYFLCTLLSVQRHSSVGDTEQCLYSVVCMLNMFQSNGDVLKNRDDFKLCFIWFSPSFACVDTDFITLLIFDSVGFISFGPTNETNMRTAHVDIFYCYVFCQSVENKIIRTEATELSKMCPRTK